MRLPDRTPPVEPAASETSRVAPSVTLRAATEGDWDLIRSWLARPEIIRWWGPKATTEAEVMLAMNAPAALCRMIDVDNAAAGYGQAVDVACLGLDHQAQLPPATWQIELFVASPAYRGKGIGTEALKLLRQEVFATTLALAACVVVALGNERAVRAYESAGFGWRAVVRDPAHGTAWLMVSERPAASSSPQPDRFFRN